METKQSWAETMSSWEQLALHFAIFGMAHWFFGNLYEEIVMTPNGLVATVAEAKVVIGYFRVSNPIIYFVPLTHLASLALIILAYRWRRVPDVSRLTKRGAITTTLALLLTVWIVLGYNNQIFGTPDALTTAQYQTMSFHWLLLNGVRMVLVGTALLSLLQVRLLLSKMSTET